jgi:hypothetical protein
MDSFVTSPDGTRFPRTPSFIEAVDTLHKLDSLLSIQKLSPERSRLPATKTSTINLSTTATANASDTAIPPNSNLHATDKLQQDIQNEYKARLEETQHQLRMLEAIIEDNEMRHAEEISAAEAMRNDERNSLHREVQEKAEEYKMKELTLREREVSVEERKLKQAEVKLNSVANNSDMSSATICCSGSISSSKCDVVLDLAGAAGLEPGLYNERLQIATLNSLFSFYTTRSPSLLSPLDDVKDGSSVECALEKFMREFASLVRMKSKSTEAVIKIIALSRINGSLQSKVRSAVKIAAASSIELLKVLTVNAKSNGKMPTLESRFKLMTLTELPGMVQLQNSDSLAKEEHWFQIGEFVSAVASYVGDRKSQLEIAKQKLNSFTGIEYSDCDLMLSDYETLWDICCDWFRGQIEIDFDKIQRLLQQCPLKVKVAYVKYMSDPANKCDDMQMSWDDFRTKLQTVWEISTDSAQMSMFLGLQAEATKVIQALPNTNLMPKPADNARSDLNSSQGLTDFNLHCKTCDSDFNFSVSQQQNYKTRGLDHLPGECPKCRGQLCNGFKETGECPYGDNCKFLHATEEQAAKIQEERSARRQRPKYPCRFFEAGRCDKGNQCQFSHEKGPG